MEEDEEDGGVGGLKNSREMGKMGGKAVAWEGEVSTL